MVPKIELPTGSRIFYTDSGNPDGPTLLFVHGWACDSHDWSWQIPEFSPDFRVVATDLRGHGRSDESDDGYAISSSVNDLAALAAELEITELIGVGHSFGGMVLSELAVTHPDLVRGLILIDPAYGGADEIIGEVGAAIPYFRGADDLSVFVSQVESLESSQTPPALGTWHMRRMLGTPREAVLATFEEMLIAPGAWAARSRSEQFLQGRKCPVLVFYVQERGEQVEWEKGLSDEVTAEVVDSGHWIHQEKSEYVNQRMWEWLKAQGVL